VVERTWSEFMSGTLGRTRVSAYLSLPGDLQAGAIAAAYNAAKGDYADGTPRYFSCQTCHMRAVTGAGANKRDVPVRADLPLHDMTGGNTWAPDAIRHQDAAGTLRLGGGLTALQGEAINAGKARAQQQLQLAASVSVEGDTVKVVNLTGHKLISGYPEGRRMWLNVKWYDGSGTQVREDGEYGVVTNVNGTPVKSIVDLGGANTRIYEAHYGMTQEWASQLLTLGYDPALPLSFDRLSGATAYTLGQLADGGDASHETFHFVLNNTVIKDNRIPTYGMNYEEARKRNALPVPADQYGSPGASGTYEYWDQFALNPPAGATYATIDLLYQSTSWEYIQFLYLTGQRTTTATGTPASTFLANEGRNLLDTWIATGMAEPVVMASATWGSPPSGGGGGGGGGQTCNTVPGTPTALAATSGKKSVTLAWQAGDPAPDTGYRVYYDQSGKRQLVGETAGTTLKDTGLTSRVDYTYVVTAWSDCNANGAFDTGTDLESAAAGPVTATAR
jgi:hypothetical protein